MINPDLQDGEENPYDFIFSQDGQNAAQTGDGKTPLRNPLTPKQYAIFGVFALGIITLAIVVLSLLFSSDPPTAPVLVRTRAYQNEIIRVSAIGNDNLSNFELRKDVDSLNIVIKTDTTRIDQLISNRKVIATPAEYTQLIDTTRDERLASSLQVDRHDTVYREIMDELVAGYYNTVLQAEASALGANERSQLEVIRRNIEIIYIDDADIQQPETPEIDPSTDPETDPSTPALTN